jgi:hypothetical protein
MNIQDNTSRKNIKKKLWKYNIEEKLNFIWVAIVTRSVCVMFFYHLTFFIHNLIILY